jgi:hypothetical protein
MTFGGGDAAATVREGAHLYTRDSKTGLGALSSFFIENPTFGSIMSNR